MRMTSFLKKSHHERGSAILIALIATILGFAAVISISELSVRNFNVTDRMLVQEDSFYAAQGTVDSVMADIDAAYRRDSAARTDYQQDFRLWLNDKMPTLVNQGSTMELPAYVGKNFNGAVVERVRITHLVRTDDPLNGSLSTFRVEAEVRPQDVASGTSGNASEDRRNLSSHLTATRLFNVTNAAPFAGTEYAILTENISCTLCHLRVSTLEFAKNVEGEASTDKFKRALIGTTKFLNARFDGADTEIHGSLYVAQGVRVQDHGNPSTLSEMVRSTNGLRMAELERPANMDADDIFRSTFTGLRNGSGIFDSVVRQMNLQTAPILPNGLPAPGYELYDQYSGNGDYELPTEFPSPFPDTGDGAGTGRKNRRIEDAELNPVKGRSNGSITLKHLVRIPHNSDSRYSAGQYTFNSDRLPELNTADPEVTITTNEHSPSNLVLIGTKDNPIRLNGQVVIQGDVMIKGYVEGKGTILATGNVYIPSDIQYKNAASNTNDEVFAQSNLLGIAAGGSIVIGDYLSKVTGPSANFDTGRYDGGTPESNPDYVTYVAEQIAIYNREELTRTLKKVPLNRGRDLSVESSYNSPNTLYDPVYTPRYYTMYPDTPAYAFIKTSGNGARFDQNTKSWVTGEAPNYYRDQFKIDNVPANVKNSSVTPRSLSIHPNWISPQNMLSLIANEEGKRIIGERNGKPFRIDGLLYTNNAIFNIQRRMSQINQNGNWTADRSSHQAKMEINGSIIAPDLGMLVISEFHVNYDRRVKDLLQPREITTKWQPKASGFSLFNGRIAP